MGDFPDRFSVDFPFRGNRGYIHSASIANHFLQGPPCDSFEIVLRQWMSSRVVFTLLAGGAQPEGTGHIRLVQGGRVRQWQMDEDKGFPTRDRVPYDEDAPPVLLDVAARSARCGPFAGVTWSDRLIAANKKLINAVLSPGVRLIATKISLNAPVGDLDPVGLRLTGNVGTRIFRSAILEGEARTGELVFYGQDS